jgi:hypothetical protein
MREIADLRARAAAQPSRSRAIIGSFHHVSIKHLDCYLAEAEYRWNHREEDLFALVVIGSTWRSVAKHNARTFENRTKPLFVNN